MSLSTTSLRTALLAGFGLTVSLWFVASSVVSARLARSGREAEVLSARYLDAQETLATVRAQVLIVSVSVRDALLDPDPRPVRDYRADIDAVYLDIDDRLERYVPVLGHSDETSRVQRMRDEIRAFHRASVEVLSTDSSSWRTEARRLLQRLLPKRASIITVSEELQALNRAVFVEQQRETRVLQVRLQEQVLLVFGAALAISILIAAAALRQGLRLERRLVEQREREKRIATDLHRLSTGIQRIQEDERRRVARELHDEIGQALSAVNLELTAADRQLQRAGVTQHLLADAHGLVDGAVRAVRDLSQLLHPSVLDDLGLSAAIGSLLRSFSRRSGVETSFEEQGISARFDPAVERAVYRVVQEAVTNVARHAQARRMAVRLQYAAGRLLAMIEDDGVGFEIGEIGRGDREPGLGVLGMRERMKPLGGTLTIDSAVGAGTRLRVEIPCDATGTMPPADGVAAGLVSAPDQG